MLITALIIGLVVSVFVFNRQQQAREMYEEITFIDPHQALIFWKTDYKAVGYVRYGKTKKKLDQTAYQTNSDPSLIHAVVIDEIPLEGIFITFHCENESFFLWHKPVQVKFNQELHEQN